MDMRVRVFTFDRNGFLVFVDECVLDELPQVIARSMNGKVFSEFAIEVVNT